MPTTKKVTSSSTRSNLVGSLTTTWTPPSSCDIQWLQCATCSSAWKGQKCLSSASFRGNYDCWPPVTSSTATPPFSGLGFYSPGIVCPVGYSTACAMQGSSNGLQATISGSQEFNFEFTPTVGETAVGCCPTGFACSSNGAQICAKEVASTTTAFSSCGDGGATLATTLAFPELFTITSATASTATETSTSTISQFTIYAPLYQLNYQATDMASLTPSTSHTTSTTQPAINTSSSSSSLSPSSAGGGARSTDSKTIAIAVVVTVIIVAFFAAGLGWFFYRKKRRNANLPTHSDTLPTELSARNTLNEMRAAPPTPPPVEMPPIATHQFKYPEHRSIVHELGTGENNNRFSSSDYI